MNAPEAPGTIPPVRVWTREAMLKRVAKFSDLKGFSDGLQDSKVPESFKTTFNVIGFQTPENAGQGGVNSPVGQTASMNGAIKISEGFNLAYCRAKPGKGPMLHNHDTNETFICMTGTWRASWLNGEGKLEHVDLKPLDLISFPPGVVRRFQNVTRGPRNRDSILMVVIAGDAPSSEFTVDSMKRIERAGVMPKEHRA